MFSKIKLKIVFVLILLPILVISKPTFATDIALGDSSLDEEYRCYLPIVLFSETPPEPEPQKFATVYVNNKLNQNLSFEILDTGIGQKIIPPGKHLYGSFPPGTYKYIASAGSVTQEKTYTYRANSVITWIFFWIIK